MKIENIGPVQFQAKWPDKLNPELKSLCSKVMHYVWKVLSHILFPILLIQWGIKMVRRLVFFIALPGAGFLYLKGHLNLIGQECLEKFGGENVKITAPDGVELDGAYFPKSSSGKAVILGLSNAMQWENAAHHCEFEQMLKKRNLLDKRQDYRFPLEHLIERGVSVLMVNPRNVGNSGAAISDEQGLSLDIWSAYEFLKSRGYQDVVFMGHSMGGATTALGAALVQEQYPDKKISAINIRSFSTLASEVKAQYGTLASLCIRLIGAELDSLSAFKKLKGQKAIFWVKSDDMIPYPAQMHSMMKDQATCYELRSDIKNPHNRHFTREENAALYAKVSEMLGINQSAQKAVI